MGVGTASQAWAPSMSPGRTKDIRGRSFRIVALAVVVALPLLGSSGIASAKTQGGALLQERRRQR
jgi:hypothetical protein